MEVVPPPDYRRTFLKLARNLTPDGQTCDRPDVRSPAESQAVSLGNTNFIFHLLRIFVIFRHGAKDYAIHSHRTRRSHAAASNISFTSTEKPGRLGEPACSPGRNTPCSL